MHSMPPVPSAELPVIVFEIILGEEPSQYIPPPKVAFQVGLRVPVPSVIVKPVITELLFSPELKLTQDPKSGSSG